MPSPAELQDAKLQRRHSEDALAKDVIDECRVQLMLKFRFLDLALWRMDLVPLRVNASYPLATDAKQVVYDPPRVIARFRSSFEESVRDYLHLVMHCIFRHPFDKLHDNREAWSLTCDILVENAVMDMCGGRFPCEDDAARRQAVSEIRMLVGKLLPNKVYGLLRNVVQAPEGQQHQGIGRSTLNEWHDLFERDDHGAWPAYNDSHSTDGDSGEAPEEVSEDDQDPDYEMDSLRTDSPSDSDPRSGGDSPDAAQMETGEESAAEDADEDAQEAPPDDGGNDAGERPEDPDDTARDEREWEDISKQIEMNLETFSKEWGEEAGSLMANLAIANRKTYSYADFLRQFMAVSEEMQLNMDEFDYIYYTYGLDLYGNLPLIEPLEYKEAERIHEFVIAVDTSESVRGDLVRKFLEHTFGILKSSEEFATEVNVHIVQCDTKIQCDTKVTDLRDVGTMMEGFTVRGFGGTDFRPVFDYVDTLRKRGELTDLKGLIYFTDGLGQFPDKPPDYDVAFVFMDEEGELTSPVPPWACKVVIDEAGIQELERERKRA